jgi:aminocarboxymuconate-semialdehyde decarboxylase
LIEDGATQIMLGTDYPFDMGAYHPHSYIAAVPGLTEQERELVLGGNAARLLGFNAAATRGA